MNIGFGSADVESVYREIRPFKERCEVKAFYLENKNTSSTALWAVMDFMDFDLEIINLLKDALETATAVPREHIHLMTTHNHGASTCDLIDQQALAQCVVTASRMAMTAAEPANTRAIVTKPSTRLNLIRRIYVPEAEGTTTIFWGPGPHNGYDSAPFVENFLQLLEKGAISYMGHCDTARPYRPYPPADDTLFLMEFISARTGAPLGSIVRFAAHAVCCNNSEYYSSDYPYYVRQGISQAFGGITVFMNGPCADIAPGMENKRCGAEKAVGRILAESALAALRERPFTPLKTFQDSTRAVELPVRHEVLEQKVQVSEELPQPLPLRKKALELLRLKGSLPFLTEKYGNGVIQKTDAMTVELGFLKLNQIRLLAFPGETFSTTAKAACKDAQDVITVTEHGRTAMYIPPEAEFRLGGYEFTCAVTKPPAEDILRQAAAQLLRDCQG